MLKIKVAAPAKINLTLEVLNKRDDGFHNIKSIMQAISLYDYLSFTIEDAAETKIILTGNSDKIPYDNKNLVYKAVEKFLEKAQIKNKKIEVYIEKNIPVEAGLAGGSTDAASAFFALNKLFNFVLSSNEIQELCASLGSDLNFCLQGGTALCTGRGENIKKINTPDLDITLIKPSKFGISAKEATWASSWPQLVTSGAMLISMIVWPMVTQVYNRKMKKRKRIETVEKYTKYLNEKKEELLQEAKLQTDILYENLLTVEQCLNIIKHQGINFWDKRIDQSDFLVTRLGIGKEHLDVKIEYPDEGFTVDEDELRKQADQLVEEFQYISNVPIGYSFYQNKTTAIMGTSYKVMHLMHNILLQLMTFYSYEDVKIVLFTNQERKEQWNYLRYLKHCFNNEESIRFFADDLESAKNVADYLQFCSSEKSKNKCLK